ncbi:MAG: AAA family ATPase [Elusimicrobiota bacterium]
MRHELTLKEFFRDAFPAAPSNRPRPPAPFVTVSREAGAGGHALAESLLQRFSKESGELFAGWQIFDKSLCERVAADPDLHVSLQSLLNEEHHTGLDDLLRSLVAGVGPQNKIDHRMFRTVRGVCVLGKAIVVGRAAALITRDLPFGVHVRLVSERKARVDRVRRETGLDAIEVGQTLDRQDWQRAREADTYFNKDIADPHLYDCVWNADAVTFEAMAESLVGLIRRRAARRELMEPGRSR